jgi:hypothetical protein
MRALLLGFLAFLLSQGATAQVGNTLPPNPSIPSPPRNGLDEVEARRRMENAGFTDIQGMMPNGIGGFTGRATPPNRRGYRFDNEVRFEIDARGRIHTW